MRLTETMRATGALPAKVYVCVCVFWCVCEWKWKTHRKWIKCVFGSGHLKHCKQEVNGRQCKNGKRSRHLAAGGSAKQNNCCKIWHTQLNATTNYEKPAW